jgi:tRNA modification GTPase
MALRHLKGELSGRYQKIEDTLLWMGAHIEAAIDFSSEGIELKPSTELLTRGLELRDQLQRLIDSYQQGRVVAQGLRIALVGAPNAGKSSLLNALVGEDRAIVTPEAGTTRDLIEVESRFRGLDLRWMDTAGLRDSQSVAEQLGIEKSLKAREEADFVLVILDLVSPDWRSRLWDFVRSGRSREIYVFNKVDLDQRGEWTAASEAEAEALGVVDRSFWISAASKQGLDQLLSGIEHAYRRSLRGGSGDDVVVSQSRHVESLERIQDALRKALVLIEKEASPELVAFELKAGVQEIHRLLGKEFHEQVIDRVFKEFCLGK